MKVFVLEDAFGDGPTFDSVHKSRESAEHTAKTGTVRGNRLWPIEHPVITEVEVLDFPNLEHRLCDPRWIDGHSYKRECAREGCYNEWIGGPNEVVPDTCKSLDGVEI